LWNPDWQVTPGSSNEVQQGKSWRHGRKVPLPSASSILGISRYFSATSKAVFKFVSGSSWKEEEKVVTSQSLLLLLVTTTEGKRDSLPALLTLDPRGQL
jgi:hypothetical protein